MTQKNQVNQESNAAPIDLTRYFVPTIEEAKQKRLKQLDSALMKKISEMNDIVKEKNFLLLSPQTYFDFHFAPQTREEAEKDYEVTVYEKAPADCEL